MKTAEARTPVTTASQRKPFFQRKGEHAFFGKNTANSFFSGSSPLIQAKLTIGAPGDKYEQEADAMADKVVQRLAAPEAVQAKPLVSATPVIQAKCAACEEEKLQKKEDETEEPLKEKVQKKPIFESNTPPPPEEAIQQKCAACGKEEKLQAKSDAASSTSSHNLESRLLSSKGGGSPLPGTTRAQMENSFGTDFSGVRVHTDSSAVQMNKELSALAFTHGSDIYFNSGKYDTGSTGGQKLLAHELTHTVQQQGATGTPQRKIQRWPDWVSDAAGWVSDTASDAASGVVEGAKWAGGQVADGARWVGGKLSSAAQWVIDQIKSVINSGKNYLNAKWEDIKQFGHTCFDDIKNGFGGLVHFITNPLSGFMTALSGMNAGMLGSIWNLLQAGSNTLWAGINSVINGVLQFGQNIWSTVSGFINGVFDTIAGLFDSTAFGLLPDFIQKEARDIFSGLQTLWNQVSSFWTDLWQRLTNSIQEILAAVRSFVDNILNFSIGSVISMVRNLKEVYDYVMKFFADPRATIQPYLDMLAEKLNKEVPPGAKVLGNKLAHDKSTGNSAQEADNGSIQRVPESSEDRRTSTLMEVLTGIVYYVGRAWAELDLKQLLWQTVVNMFWPPATISAIVDLFSQLWNDHWATTIDSLYGPRNFFDDPIGCLHDIWSNFLILLDFPLSLWRTLNNVMGLLMGYITIILIVVEAVLGGIAAVEVGVVPGLLAGAALGLETAGIIGEALMLSYVLAEGLTVEVVLVRLFTARQVCEKREVDILTSVASFIAMAVALALQLLMALLAELVSLIANLIKGSTKPVPVPQPTPQPQPLPVPRPQPVPQPVPAQPVPLQPVPVQPIPLQPAPVQPPPNVIPFPTRPARPVTPANPGRIAAKFADGVNTVPPTQALQNEEKSPIKSTKSGSPIQEKETMPLSGVYVSGDGTLQTKAASRESRINPDVCKKKKGICYETSLAFSINRTSMPFIGIGATPDDLRIAACLLRTATGTTFRSFGKNIAIGKFLVNGSFDYIPGVNIPRGNIHSEDIILIEANRRYGAGNYKLAALFSERVPCDRCEGSLRGTPLTPDARIYCIINNDYDRRSIMRAYNDGVLF